jgi:hypothetical protein
LVGKRGVLCVGPCQCHGIGGIFSDLQSSGARFVLVMLAGVSRWDGLVGWDKDWTRIYGDNERGVSMRVLY